MPKNKSFGKLSELTTESVWKWLICLVKKSGRRSRKKQRHFLAKILPHYLRQELLKRTMRDHLHQVNADYKCSLIEILANEKTSCIDFSRSGCMLIDEVLDLYFALRFSKVTNISSLGAICDLKNIDRKYVPDANARFYHTLKSMNNLRWLTLTSIANTRIMKILGTNCKHLKYLNVRNSNWIDDNSVMALLLTENIDIENMPTNLLCFNQNKTTPCALNLCHLDVSGTHVSLKGAILILSTVSNLTSLGGQIDAGSTSEAIAVIANESYQHHLALKLTHLWDTRLLPENATLVDKMCPEIDNVHIDAAWLTSLSNMHPITSLHINADFSNFVCEIYNYLYTNGIYITELRIEKGMRCYLDLGWLVKLTPTLQCLEAHLESFDGPVIPGWKYLKTAIVTISSSQCLTVLCKHAPNLEVLEVKYSNKNPYDLDWHCVDDSLFVNILESGSLIKLQRLVIYECSLSIKTINSLIVNCSTLSYLGNLNWWENLSKADINNIKSTMQNTNCYLKIVIHNENYDKEKYD